MPRPKLDHPTPAELEVLQVLWQRGPSTVREVKESLATIRRGRAYTSVMSLLNLMYEKRLVKRRMVGKAFVYEARISKSKTLGQLIQDVYRRVFAGSASSLVAHMLDETQPTTEELKAIREAIDAYQKRESSP